VVLDGWRQQLPEPTGEWCGRSGSDGSNSEIGAIRNKAAWRVFVWIGGVDPFGGRHARIFSDFVAKITLLSSLGQEGASDSKFSPHVSNRNRCIPLEVYAGRLLRRQATRESEALVTAASRSLEAKLTHT